MQACTQLQLNELRGLISDLGKDGGLISPSIYDTAQVVRFALTAQEAEPALTWLLGQQRADGGWGDAAAPYARHVPTLAAVLAIHHSNQHKGRACCEQQRRQVVVDAGLAFLQQEAIIWHELSLDLLPIAAEMILPRLIEEAIAAALPLDPEPYRQLFQLREHKCRQIHKAKPAPGAAPTYSWEAWGSNPMPPLFDRSGGIGHSPSATAAWLKQSAHCPQLADHRNCARDYLSRAAAATGVDIPGVVPNVYPIIGFELSYGLYTLLITGLLNHPLLQMTVNSQLSKLSTIMQQGNGVSFGDHFTPDVDETGVAMAALCASRHAVCPEVVMQFKSGDHFCTFPHELNPSVFSNAHALYALAQVEQREPVVEAFLVEQQQAQGGWLADKWHSSWLYTTLEVATALQSLDYQDEIRYALDAVLAAQKADGGWGSTEGTSTVETSYMVILLQVLAKRGNLPAHGETALVRGHSWLSEQFSPNYFAQENLWLGKELYSPYRVDRIYELCSLLMVELAR